MLRRFSLQFENSTTFLTSKTKLTQTQIINTIMLIYSTQIHINIVNTVQMKIIKVKMKIVHMYTK